MREQPPEGTGSPTAPEQRKGERSHRRWRPGKVVDFFFPLTSYLFTNLTVSLIWILFRILNRTTVIGRENLREDRNTLLLSNHQTMIDSFPVGIFAFFPKSLVKPHLIPWNPAAEENFYKSTLLAIASHHWKCIPVKEGRRDLHALHRMIKALPKGVMTLFPEGTRSRDGSVGRGRPGAGLVILGTRPHVIPVAIDGVADVLPIGRIIPRVFKRVYISYGPPIDYSDFLDQPRSRETAQAVVDRAMDAVRRQHEEIRSRRKSGKVRAAVRSGGED